MSVTQTPLSFEISAELASQLEKLRKQVGGVSIAKVVHLAIDRYDFKQPSSGGSGERRQLSVRLDSAKRESLENLSKANKVSMAHLVRKALESLLGSPNAVNLISQQQTEGAAAPAKASRRWLKTTGTSAVKKKPVNKTPVSKTAAKKAVVKKSATPKAPAKKSAAPKAPAKKAVAAKAPAKKAVAAKAPAKKAVVKKVSKPVVKRVVAKKVAVKAAAPAKAPAKKGSAKKAKA